MVIQRWQSVFLLLAAIVMAFFCVTPFAIQDIGVEEAKVYPSQIIDFLVLVIITVIILLISIFLFKNMRQQKRITCIAIVLQIIVAARGFLFTILQGKNATIEWSGGILLVACALLLTLAAYRRICKDERLLKSYDRIR